MNAIIRNRILVLLSYTLNYWFGYLESVCSPDGAQWNPGG